ncbi:retinaldehyde-binding protein 1-like [Uloborus diversus]|uniref:retinaldehyde-binding protein 1-like n=1 Tax=Uloborus diversus TaxID=327109 RepID=UPI0024094E3A|nr:retinaldehyde-binding protein 1-like [Uloborus diversus]
MEFLPMCCETIPEEIRAKVENEINETEENIRNGLKSLKEFLKRENIRSRTDDAFLLWFLRAQKYNIKKSQEKLRRYCTMRRNIRELLEGTNIDKIQEVLDRQMVGVLPHRDKQGRTVIYTRGYAWDPKQIDLDDAARCAILLIHFCLLFPMTSIRGFSYIGEARVNSILDIYSIYKILMAHVSTVTAMPCRFQRVDVLNENKLFHHLYIAAKPLLPSKLTKRIFLRGKNLEHLKENCHPSILPYEFGGTMGPLSNESYREKFLEFVQKMKSDCVNFVD